MHSTAFNIVALGVLSVAVIVALIIGIVAQAQAANAAKSAATRAKTEQARLQNALCGLVVPIAKEPINARSTPLAKTVIVGARHSTVVIPCPKGK
jgi:hypothetical protein